MPFTVSHASAIIPFHRKPYVLSALIVGSMSPDFLYYQPYIPNYEFTHSIAGLFLFCLPVSLLFLLVYHRLLKQPLIGILPQQIQGKLWQLTGDFSFFPLLKFGSIALSILIGAATHIIWDSFTHGGHADLFLPWLDTPVFEVAGKTIQIYKIFQYLSSVFGLLIFLAWFARLTWRQQPAEIRFAKPSQSGVRWLILMLALSSAFGLAHGLNHLLYDTFRSFVVQTLVASMGAMFVLLMIYSVIWHLRTDFLKKTSKGLKQLR